MGSGLGPSAMQRVSVSVTKDAVTPGSRPSYRAAVSSGAASGVQPQAASAAW